VTDRSLDFCILRKGRKVTEINKTADPDDYGSMQKVLTDWLTAQRWDKGLWGRFEAEVRIPGRGKLVARVVP
jgi:hypothetical protein